MPVFTLNQTDGDSAGQIKTAVRVDGQEVASYTNTPPQFRPMGRLRQRALKADLFAGPKLKIERAKRHIHDLDVLLQRFLRSDPYAFVTEKDAQTGEDVLRASIKKPIPSEVSVIIGDAVHNLRCALDYLVCDLIRANGKEPNGNSGLPLHPKGLKPGPIPKINGVSAKAERFIIRLKSSQRWNSPLWTLHMLDIFDKHNCIVTVAAATVQVHAVVIVPGLFRGPNGELRMGGPGPDGVPFARDAGVPDTFHRVLLGENDVEVYRFAPGLDQDVKVTFGIAFCQGQVAQGEPVGETLEQFVHLLERILILAERRAL